MAGISTCHDGIEHTVAIGDLERWMAFTSFK
jgi:hypothetical protein